MIPDMQYGMHNKIVEQNTRASHRHFKHNDTQVPSNDGRAGNQAVSRRSVWLVASFKRVLLDEFVDLSPKHPMKMI
jgi:hypothetical protein